MQDPTRTIEPCTARADDPLRVWSFGHLMQRLADQQGVDAPEMVLRWAQSWDTEQIVNGFRVPRSIGPLTRSWLERSGGQRLNLALAPFRLEAIVNRIDLRQVNEHGAPINAGESRLIFSLVNVRDPPFCGDWGPWMFKPAFAIIFELNQSATSAEEVTAWAREWKSLDDLPAGSAELRNALERLTERSSPTVKRIRTHAMPGGYNAPWQFRQFTVREGALALEPLSQTPSRDPGIRATLYEWLQAHQSQLIDGTYQIPKRLLAGSIEHTGNPDSFWSYGGLSPEAGHQFALNTCNGCHRGETNTSFVHVWDRELSGFLTGIRFTESLDGQQYQREFHELDRRRLELENLLQGNLVPQTRSNSAH